MNEEQLGIESALWETANSLRGSVASSDYKHVVLGLLFMKYIFDYQAPIEKISFPRVTSISWGDFVTASRSEQALSQLDVLIEKIENENPSLTQTFPRFKNFEGLRTETVAKLIDTITPIDLSAARDQGKDLLSRTYEYFLTKFAAAEGRLGGEFYTPRSIVKLMVDLQQPFSGTIYDPACGTGGLLVQAKTSSILAGRTFENVKVIGQESNPMTWRLAKLNLALHQLDFDLGKSWGDTFSEDQHKSLKADFILTNPPFGKGTEWPRGSLALDPRWKFGLPPEKPANYAWLQHYIARLSDDGVAVAVMPNGTLTSRSIEGQIRKELIEADLVECIVSLPGQLFYSTPIPVSLWIINKNKSSRFDRRARKGEILMIDARELGYMTSRVHKDLSNNDITKIVQSYHSWQGRTQESQREIASFARSASLDEVRAKAYSLNPSEYVETGIAVDEDAVASSISSRTNRITESLTLLFRAQESLADATGKGLTTLKPFVNGDRWKEMSLREVCKIIGGGTPDTRNKDFFGGEVPWVTPRDMASHVGREIYGGERTLSESGLKNSGAKLIPKNSVLVSSRAPIGLIAIAGCDLATNQGIRSLVLDANQDPRFWFYLMKSSSKQLDSAGNGTTFRELRGSTMLEMKFQVPDLETQVLIADHLDRFQAVADSGHNASVLLQEHLADLSPMLTLGFMSPSN